MPQYLVRFAQSVDYLPGHFMGRPVAMLAVHAADPEQAKLHAIRVTAGDPGEITVEEDPGSAPPPSVEAPDA